MIRAWLASLGGRLVLLLVGAICLAQAITFAVYFLDRQRLVDSITEELVVSRLPSAVRTLRQLDTDARQGVIQALSSRWTGYQLAARPSVAGDGGADRLARMLRDSLESPPGDMRLAVKTFDKAPGADWHNVDSRKQLHIAVRLNEATWLNSVKALPDTWHLASEMLLPMGLSVLAVIAVAVYQARRIARPLDNLAQQAERFGGGEAVERLTPAGPANVARTIEAFNDMSERQQRFIADRTRLLAAISHDLRTPITAMRLRIESVDDDEVREALERVLAEMESMVEATLSFTHAGAGEGDTHEVDLVALVRDTIAEADPSGEALAFEPPETAPPRCRCRPLGVTRALRNVLDNAIRYGGTATVGLETGDDRVSIHIRDRGPGIPEGDQEAVFAPFYRLERSRSLDTGGSGLGLAIARNIVRGHGGDVETANTPEGLRVTISLPIERRG